MIHRTGRAHPARAALASACLLALLAGTGIVSRPLPASAQEAASAVQDVTLSDVVLAFGTTRLEAPRLTVSGTHLSKDEIAAILRTDSPEPWAARLGRLNAASLTIPELRFVHAPKDGARQSVVYRDVAARDVRAGRIAELAAAGAAIAMTGVPGAPAEGTGTYGRIAARDLDLAALARLYGGTGERPADPKGAAAPALGPAQIVYSAFSVDDVIYTDGSGTTARLARLEGRDVGGRPIPGGWSGAVDRLTEIDPDRIGDAERAKAGAILADLIEGAFAGAVEARGFALSQIRPGRTAGRPDASEQPLLFEIAHMSASMPRMEPGSPDAGASFGLEGLSFSQGATRGRLGRVALTGFSPASTAAALRRLSTEGKPGAEPKPDAKPAPVLGTLSIEDASLDLPVEEPAKPRGKPAPGRAAAVEDAVRRAAREKGAERGAAAQQPPAKIMRVGMRSAAMTFGPMRDGVPTTSRLSLSGITLPAASVSEVPGLGSLAAYGYGDLDLDATVDTAWDEGKREVSVREVSLSGRDMGSLRLSGTIGGIGPEMFDTDPAVSGLAMLSATAKSLDLTVQDGGLFDRFIAAQSKVLSLKPEELRQEYVTASVLGVPVILGNSPAARAIGAALGQFVTKPGRLSLSARTKDAAGLGIAEFGTAPSPGAVLDRLDVTAKAE